MTKKGYEYKPLSKLPKMIPKFNQRQFANFVTGDKIWVHYFKPVRTIGNPDKPLAQRSASASCIPKSAYCDAFQKWIRRMKLCISNRGEYFEGM